MPHRAATRSLLSPRSPSVGCSCCQGPRPTVSATFGQASPPRPPCSSGRCPPCVGAPRSGSALHAARTHGVPELEVSGAQISHAQFAGVRGTKHPRGPRRDGPSNPAPGRARHGRRDGRYLLPVCTLPGTLWLARLASAATGCDHRVCCRVVGGPDHHTRSASQHHRRLRNIRHPDR